MSRARWIDFVTRFETPHSPLNVKRTLATGAEPDFSWDGSHSERLRFQLLASEAAALAFPTARDPIRAWLEDLTSTFGLRNTREAGPEILPDGSRRFYYMGWIGREFSDDDVWRLSADRCQMFALDSDAKTETSSELRTADGSPKLGRKPSTQVDGMKLKKLRGDGSQEWLAEAAAVSVATIQRGEAGLPWSDQTFDAVEKVLSDKVGAPVALRK